MSEATPIFDAFMRVDNIPSKGRRLKVELDEVQRIALAKELKLDKLNAFSAKLLVLPIKGGLQVNVELSAIVEQQCVVSFKPVEQVINECLERIFLMGEMPKNAGDGSESFIDMEGDELPDYYTGSEVDFSVLLIETLVLAIEPFPRLEGEKMDIDQDETQFSPFAVLTSLKRD